MSESALIKSCFEEIASHVGKYFPAKDSVEYKERKKQFTKTCKLLLKEVAAEQEEEELQVKAKPQKKSTQRKQDEAELGEPVTKKKVKIGVDEKKKSIKKKSSTSKKSKK